MHIINAIKTSENERVKKLFKGEFSKAAKGCPEPFNNVEHPQSILMWENSVAAACAKHEMNYEDVSVDDVSSLDERFFQSAAKSYTFIARLSSESIKYWNGQ